MLFKEKRKESDRQIGRKRKIPLSRERERKRKRKKGNSLENLTVINFVCDILYVQEVVINFT